MENNQPPMPKARFKEIEVEGRRFILGKMNPLQGSYIAFKLVGKLLPIMKNLPENDEELNLTELACSLETLFDMPQKDFEFIQKSALTCVSEQLPAGNTPVIDRAGNFGVLDVDTPLIMNLTVQSLMFNMSGFFNEGILGSLAEKMPASSQQNLRTLMHSPGAQ